ncbi:AraC family transcriptional regulator [Sinimarinibacterium thermocellulolyticum]|uniref:AraC family transcriptional regulator n=1 Tax=Sinimarinibacterium thermocellulolyticum TaxID=3170016 RepID=A0ABV2A6W0_9GAMM
MTARANTVAVGYLHALLDYARARGLALDALRAALPFDPSDRDARVPEALGAALFDRAAALLEDDALGLHVGEQVRPGHYGALGFVAMNCERLGEALDALRRYQALVIDLGGVGLKRDEQTCTLSWNPGTDGPYRQLAEFNLAGLVTFARWMAGAWAKPLRIDVMYAAPADTREHTRILGCPLRFAQACYRVVLPIDALDAPLIQPDPAMRELMQRLADQQLRALPRGDDWLTRLRAQIARRLRQPPVELDAVAAALALSSRSLQRRLQAEGLRFSALVEQVRRELAERHLADASLDLADIALLLGYSEQSAFQRAFKRWTGQTPAQWRAAHTEPRN